MSDTNRAAEGLRRMFSIPEGEALNKAMGWTLNETFDAALAHERSAGAAPLDVERLEFALHEHYGEGNDDTCWHSHDAERVARIYERADVYGYVARLASEGTDR